MRKTAKVVLAGGLMAGLVAEAGLEWKNGDEVVCFGACGKDSITPDDWAALKGTHAYDIICSLGTRVERVVKNAEA